MLKPAKIRIGDSKVLESRESTDGESIRRRRVSSDGKHRFTTYERIELPTMMVLKRSGRQELFDQEKLFLAVKRSVGKFFESDLEVEKMVERVTEELYGLNQECIKSQQIGEAILDELANSVPRSVSESCRL